MTSSYSAAAADGRRPATAVPLPPPQPPSGCVPNTPDVINSIMSMMNPFEHHYRSPASDDSTSSSTCSPVSPPRMPNICSRMLIKEELKLVIRNKQKNRSTVSGTPATPAHPTLAPVTDGAASNSPGGFAAAIAAATASMGSAASSPGGGQAKKRRTDEESHGDEDYDDDEDVSSHGEGLTAEDEERRRRRRERNKIAATKCRQKKREKTSNLMQESNVLEKKNSDMKTQIQELETQRNDLMKMLTEHDCSQRLPYQHQQQPPQQLHQQNHHLRPPQHQQHHQQQQQPHHQHHHHHHHHQHLHHQEHYAAGEPPYSGVNDPYRGQHHQVAAEPPILKDAMFNGGGGYGAVASAVADPSTAAAYHRPATTTTAAYHRPPATTTAATVAAVHYPTPADVAVGGIGFAGVGAGASGVGGGSVYTSCLQDDVYVYNKDLMAGGTGGPPDLSHQYYDQGIC